MARKKSKRAKKKKNSAPPPLEREHFAEREHFSPDLTIRDLVRKLFGAEFKPEGCFYVQTGSADERNSEIDLQLGLTIVPDPNASVIDRLADILQREERESRVCGSDGCITRSSVHMISPDGEIIPLR